MAQSFDDLFQKYNQQYHRKVHMLAYPEIASWLGQGGRDIGDIMLNDALQAESSQIRNAQETARIESAANFGGNTSMLNSLIDRQTNLLSNRPGLEAGVSEAGRQAFADSLNTMQGLFMGKPSYISGMLQPWFQNQQLELAAGLGQPQGNFLSGMLGSL